MPSLRLDDYPAARDLAERVWREVQVSGQPATDAASDAGGRFLRALLSLLGLPERSPDGEQWTAELALDTHRVLELRWRAADGWSASAGVGDDAANDPLSRTWANIGRIEGVEVGKIGRTKRGS